MFKRNITIRTRTVTKKAMTNNITDQEFLQLLEDKGFTALSYMSYWDDIQEFLEDNEIDLGEQDYENWLEEAVGYWEEVEQINEISTVLVVLYFPKFDKHVIAYGEHNSYESTSEWDNATWHLAEAYEVTETKYRIKK